MSRWPDPLLERFLPQPGHQRCVAHTRGAGRSGVGVAAGVVHRLVQAEVQRFAIGAFKQAAVETTLMHLGACGARHQKLGQRCAEQASASAVHREVHAGHHAVGGDARGQSLQLFAAFGAVGCAARGRGRVEQCLQQHGKSERFGGVATGPAAVPRGFNHGLDLGRHRHWAQAGEDVLEAHLHVHTQLEHEVQELQCLFVAVRSETNHRRPERHR